MSGNTLTFTTANGATQVVALTAIDRLEVARGKRSGGLSALMGAGLGLAAVIAITAVIPCQDGEFINDCHQFGAIVWGVPATLSGAIVGFFFLRGNRWVEVPLR
jgi:hypothetical protein